jgi:acylphosphatase
VSERTAREVVVHGRVQGVFFRDTCQSRAEDAGVTGWVSNEPDGTVRAHFEGSPEGVERMVAWAREGSRSADVARVDVSETAAEGLDAFEVR